MTKQILTTQQQQALEELMFWFNQEIKKIKAKQLDIIKRYEEKKRLIVRARIADIKERT